MKKTNEPPQQAPITINKGFSFKFYKLKKVIHFLKLMKYFQ